MSGRTTVLLRTSISDSSPRRSRPSCRRNAARAAPPTASDVERWRTCIENQETSRQEGNYPPILETQRKHVDAIVHGGRGGDLNERAGEGKLRLAMHAKPGVDENSEDRVEVLRLAGERVPLAENPLHVLQPVGNAQENICLGPFDVDLEEIDSFVEERRERDDVDRDQ